MSFIGVLTCVTGSYILFSFTDVLRESRREDKWIKQKWQIMIEGLCGGYEKIINPNHKIIRVIVNANGFGATINLPSGTVANDLKILEPMIGKFYGGKGVITDGENDRVAHLEFHSEEGLK